MPPCGFLQVVGGEIATGSERGRPAPFLRCREGAEGVFLRKMPVSFPFEAGVCFVYLLVHLRAEMTSPGSYLRGLNPYFGLSIGERWNYFVKVRHASAVFWRLGRGSLGPWCWEAGRSSSPIWALSFPSVALSALWPSWGAHLGKAPSHTTKLWALVRAANRSEPGRGSGALSCPDSPAATHFHPKLRTWRLELP